MLAAMPAAAQEAKAPAAAGDTTPGDEDGGDIANEIIVTAQNVRGQVDTAIPPVQELSEEDIAAYGAGSITDLIAALAPQTSSGRGRGSGPPALLINGVRVSSFREMANFPPESIKKVEILPEEVALKYGFSADQRLINIILKDNFASRVAEAEYSQPWAGGTSTEQLEGTMLRISGPSRMNIHAEWSGTSLLTEAERGVVQSTPDPLAGDPDPADYRSLVSKNSDLQLTGNWTTKLADNGSALSVNGQYERDHTTALSGLNSVTLVDPDDDTVTQYRTFGSDDPLQRVTHTDTVSFGSTLNAPLGSWQVNATVDASHANSVSRIDRYADTQALQDAVDAGTLQLDDPLPAVADPGYDTAKTVTDSATSKVTAMGSPFSLPAGEVSMTLHSGYSWNRVQTEDTRSTTGKTTLTRGDLTAGVNVGIPLAERGGSLGFIGDLNLNLNAGIDQLSDFGTLTNWTAGLSWRPLDTLSFKATYFASDAAPTLAQLNSPQTLTLNVPVYDLTTGQTVLVSVLGGGNPDLEKQKQRDYTLGAQYQLPFLDGSNISVDYFHNHSSNVSAAFPDLTADIEAAFPDRVTRVDGVLTQIDERPVTFASENSARLRFGLNLTGPFGKKSATAGGGFGLFGAVRSAMSGQGANGGAPARPAAPVSTPGAGAQGPVGSASPVAPAAPGGTGGGFAPPGGAFDPQRFQEMRQKLCADGAETPDISTLPEPMQERMKGADGKLDPAKFAEFKQRVCSGGAGAFNPQQFQEFRQKLCAPGDTPPDLSALPERFQDRLKGPDGKVDPARFKEFKDRICSMPTVAPSPNGSGEGGRGQGGDAGGPPPMGAGGPPPGAGPGGPPPRGGGRGGFRGPGADGRGRWFLNLTYTLELENQVLIAEGLPVLDQLDGDQLSGGAVVRNSAQLQGGLFYHGIGLRYSGTYSGASDLNGTTTDLHFHPLTTFDLQLFADLGQQAKLVEKVPFFKGTRVSVGVDNVFDSIRKVTDENGDVPLRYQAGLIDPNGRVIKVQFRKMF